MDLSSLSAMEVRVKTESGHGDYLGCGSDRFRCSPRKRGQEDVVSKSNPFTTCIKREPGTSENMEFSDEDDTANVVHVESQHQLNAIIQSLETNVEQMPKVSTPNSSVPQMSLPNMSVPYMSVPQTASSKATVPKTSKRKMLKPRKSDKVDFSDDDGGSPENTRLSRFELNSIIRNLETFVEQRTDMSHVITHNFGVPYPNSYGITHLSSHGKPGAPCLNNLGVPYSASFGSSHLSRVNAPGNLSMSRSSSPDVPNSSNSGAQPKNTNSSAISSMKENAPESDIVLDVLSQSEEHFIKQQLKLFEEESKSPSKAKSKYTMPGRSVFPSASFFENNMEEEDTGDSGQGEELSDFVTVTLDIEGQTYNCLKFVGGSDGIRSRATIRKRETVQQTIQTPREELEKSFQCPECPTVFTRAANLKTHMKIHTGEYPFHCTECPSKFRTASYLRAHVRTHTGEKPHHCKECPAAFAHAGDLTKHMRTHTGERPHPCPHCPAAFAKSGNLKIHLRIHTGENPYQCTECPSAFKSSCNLKVHMRIHTGEKPYKCVECDSVFARCSELKVHMRIHSGEKPYQCQECPAAFRNASNLRRHIKTHFNGYMYGEISMSDISSGNLELVELSSQSLDVADLSSQNLNLADSSQYTDSADASSQNLDTTNSSSKNLDSSVQNLDSQVGQRNASVNSKGKVRTV